MSALSQEAIIEAVKSQFEGKIIAEGGHNGQSYIVIDRDDLIEISKYLKETPELKFDMLSDVTAVDHLLMEVDEIPERYAVVYQLTSFELGHRFRVKVPVPEEDTVVPSLYEVWRAASWGERETHDMYGIEFDGNPDLRRLLMPSDYDGFPLRKDYPLRGRGERDDFQQIRRGEDFDAEDQSTEEQSPHLTT